MMRGRGIGFWILLILFIIGVAKTFLENPTGTLIPLLVFGGIYYFYKHPEKVSQFFYRTTPKTSYTKNKKKKKTSPFTVIKGNKDDDQPKYH